MNKNRVSDDFFKNAILKGNTDLFDSFDVSVIEKKIGNDCFFEISRDSEQNKINERITKFILSRQPVNSAACGFIKGKSYFDFLKSHTTGYYFLRLDIKNFFHSIPVREVNNLLESLFSSSKNGKSYSALDLAKSTVLHTVSKDFPDLSLRGEYILPIGFPSSPAISNIIFRKVDILIQKYCDDKNIIYSRYADDLLFSSINSNFIHSEQFEKEISIFISTLSLNLKKSKRKACKNTISLNGYVIQNTKPKKIIFNMYYSDNPVGTIRLSNKKLQILKKVVAALFKKKSAVHIMENIFDLSHSKFKKSFNSSYYFYNKYSEDQLQNKLRGYRSYLVSLIKYNEKHECVDKNCLITVKSLAKALEEFIL
ncbi:reverse transcriptase family protein [Yersinia pseudotuberculosis]|uniref:reverse transcriptase family protein n=1 Tax=Yersinia pseudotuberculosis TaxID=633 RepID=UPI000F6D5984|nr:reverse transcriptase family protein [Yersinia pseudotuberculosis]VEE72838.1 Retron-type reverse transcriptase [Yersinia pseudotuberculosis]